ncbi:hypothetical protein KEM60_03053 [Austwickia sp. TVS 96-490-7B]|uniref:IucA/IucC family protein n=1 Tax=Austwickia sp. TVS 96-490-7B TaxID=2830843 RepID=UPI001C58AF90|nr:IucA/IucC family protein [Austwickia sp. TVS 96-490-7B]MBW3086824.1 hypothetical protein [Austwickia sp. TVS 96-490-7B]
MSTGHTVEADLVLRVLSALVREDVVGLRSDSEVVERPDGLWLQLSVSDPERHLLVPVRPDGFQSWYDARLPLLRVEPAGEELRTCQEILTVLADLAAPADRPGFAMFVTECDQTVATMQFHADTHDAVHADLVERQGADVAQWRGWTASLGFDALAARLDHPVYPTARGRSGLSLDDLQRYAPESAAPFELRWLAVPREALSGPAVDLVTGPDRPEWWPAAGTPPHAGEYVAVPVHPLTVGAALDEALQATGLTGRAHLIDATATNVAPTLSMRTVSVSANPQVHLKLPLATATLGARNRRTISPGTLVDGAMGQRLLEAVIARTPRFQGVIVHADEQCYLHAGHELIGALIRQWPDGLDDAVVVPLAALLAESPDGRLVLDALADHFTGGDPVDLLDRLWQVLFDWQATLFAYGIALESHQQNISVALDHHPDGAVRVRLLFKDDDGLRVHTSRLLATLGADAVDLCAFDDSRICGADDTALTDLFTTITVHLCAGAYAFGLTQHGRVAPGVLQTMIRDRLREACDRIGSAPGEPGAVLRTHVLDRVTLPVKAMISAGTLLTKERSGAADINKHYTVGPNYLQVRR